VQEEEGRDRLEVVLLAELGEGVAVELMRCKGWVGWSEAAAAVSA